ncbi:MAG: SDR family oxidoreductase [Planctomycetaceae bacterium]|nr:SDR family oxidoreductase [Planctomycetaceae bacterium]
MARILVTGGAGFIGSHLVAALVGRGEAVRVLDNFCTGKHENLAPLADKIELIEADLNDAPAVARAVTGCEVVLHQAALASVPLSVERPLDTHAACASGTLNLLDQARRAGVRRVVYGASSSAYGNQPTPRKVETDLPAVLSPYAAAKLAGELYCQAFWHSYGLETVCLRYFNVFGPRQDPSGPYAAVIPIFIKSILTGTRPMIYGDGLQTRDFTHVENVVQANLKAAAAPAAAAGRVFNIGNGEAVSLLGLLQILNELMGSRIEPIFAPARAGDVRDSLADISQARRVLGYEPTVDLRTGLKPTIDYYRAAS